MNVHVHTAEGIATICGDVIYDFDDEIVEPFHDPRRPSSRRSPAITVCEAHGKGRDQQAAFQLTLPSARA